MNDVYAQVKEFDKKMRAVKMDKSLIAHGGMPAVRKDYNARIDAIESEAKEVIFLGSSFANHPHGREIFDAVWAEAYERGHSAGLMEVYNEFVELDTFAVSVLNIANGG